MVDRREMPAAIVKKMASPEGLAFKVLGEDA